MDTRVRIRTAIRNRRKQLTIKDQQCASLMLKKQLSNHPKIVNAEHIALYLANDGELDMQLFIDWCWQQGKKVYLPVLHPFQSCNLLFLRYDKDCHLDKNIFGIGEPRLDVTKVCPIDKLDILCTPLVAFDDTGARLGMGGGFYDRTLASWYQEQQDHCINKQKTTFYPLGIAHDCQQVESVPIEDWDIPLPEIMTPTKTVKWQFKNDN